VPSAKAGRNSSSFSSSGSGIANIFLNWEISIKIRTIRITTTKAFSAISISF